MISHWGSQLGPVSNLFSLVWVYGISTIVGYLMPNPVFTSKINIWLVNIFCKYIQLNGQTVLFLINQFSINQQSLMISSITIYH